MKLRNSFQARISLFLALLLLLVIGAVYFAVKAVTITVASDQAQEQLKTGTRVFERFMDLRWRRIQYGLNWLTNDSDFREATINGSPSLIERALQEFESSLHGSELFVLDLDGNIITSTLKGLPPGQALRASFGTWVRIASSSSSRYPSTRRPVAPSSTTRTSRCSSPCSTRARTAAGAPTRRTSRTS